MQRPRFPRRAASGVALATTLALAGGLVSSFLSATKVQAAMMPTTWTQDQPTTSPPSRFGFSMAFDPATDTTLLFGGDTATLTGSNKINDTWTWDGINWTQDFPGTSPSPRRDAFMAYDAVTKSMILFGGEDQNNNFLNDTWSWNGSNWTQLSPTTRPGARSTDAAGFMADDPAMNEDVLFGGNTGLGGLTDTWSWNGSTWTQISPGTTSDPPNSTLGGVAYDEAHQQLVYLEGSNQETWLWGPQPGAPQGAWTSAGFQPLSGITSSSLPAMAYDPSSQTVILFGGAPYPGAAETATNTTWSWDGGSKTWTQLSPSTSPSARVQAVMVTDDSKGVVFLFGGISTTQPNLNDTWQWGDPVGVYGAYTAQSYATTAINDGWPIIADAAAHGSTSSPYTVVNNGNPDQNVEQAITAAGKPRSAITWMSFWTVGGPAPGDTWNNDGYQAGRKAASTVLSYSSTVLPDYLILDDEGPGAPPNSSANWTSWLQGWASGVASINSGLRVGFYANQSQFQTYGLTSQAMPGFVAVNPIFNSNGSPNTPYIKGGNVTGYIAYYAGCPGTSYENQIKSWGARFNTLQFSDSGVDCGP